MFGDVCMFLLANSLRFSQRGIMNAHDLAQGNGGRRWLYGNENSLLFYVPRQQYLSCFSTTCYTDGSLHHPCSDRTRKGCFILGNAVCLALKWLWLYRRWSTLCCYPSLSLCYMVWACEHSGNPAELCDSRDVPALRTHPLPAAGKTIKYTHTRIHTCSLTHHVCTLMLTLLQTNYVQL